MSGIGDVLFGKTEDASYVGDAPTMTPEQEDLLQQLNLLLQGQLGEGAEQYTGSLVPGPTGIQSGVFDSVQALLEGGGINAGTNEASEAISSILQGGDTPTVDTSSVENWWQGNVDTEYPTLESITKNWESTVKDPAIKAWKEDIIPQLKEEFISQNAGSSSGAHRALTRSGEDLMTNLASNLSQTVYDTQNAASQRAYESSSTLGQLLAGLESGNVASENTALDRILSGAGVASGLDSSTLNNLLAALGIGGTEHDIQGAQNTADYNQWLATQPYNNPWLNLVNTALGQTAFEPVVQGPTQTEGIMNSIISGLGNQDWGSMGGSS